MAKASLRARTSAALNAAVQAVSIGSAGCCGILFASSFGMLVTDVLSRGEQPMRLNAFRMCFDQIPPIGYTGLNTAADKEARRCFTGRDHLTTESDKMTIIEYRRRKIMLASYEDGDMP
jgi:hypothetical protein